MEAFVLGGVVVPGSEGGGDLAGRYARIAHQEVAAVAARPDDTFCLLAVDGHLTVGVGPVGASVLGFLKLVEDPAVGVADHKHVDVAVLARLRHRSGVGVIVVERVLEEFRRGCVEGLHFFRGRGVDDLLLRHDGVGDEAVVVLARQNQEHLVDVVLNGSSLFLSAVR